MTHHYDAPSILAAVLAAVAHIAVFAFTLA